MVAKASQGCTAGAVKLLILIYTACTETGFAQSPCLAFSFTCSLQANLVMVAEVLCRNLGMQRQACVNSSQAVTRAEQLSPRKTSACTAMLDAHPVHAEMSQTLVWSLCPDVCVSLAVAGHQLAISTGTELKQMSFGLVAPGVATGAVCVREGCLVKACSPSYRHALSGSVTAHACKASPYVLQAFSLHSIWEICSASSSASLRRHRWHFKTSRSPTLQIMLTRACHVPRFQELGSVMCARDSVVSLYSGVCWGDAELSCGLPGCSLLRAPLSPSNPGVWANRSTTVSMASTLQCEAVAENGQLLVGSRGSVCRITESRLVRCTAYDSSVLELARRVVPSASAHPTAGSRHLFVVCWPRCPQLVASGQAPISRRRAATKLQPSAMIHSAVLWIWRGTSSQPACGVMNCSIPILCTTMHRQGSELRLLASAVASCLMRALPAGSHSRRVCGFGCCSAPAQWKFHWTDCIENSWLGSDATPMDVDLLSYCLPSRSFPLHRQTYHSFPCFCTKTCCSASCAAMWKVSHQHPSLQSGLKAALRRHAENDFCAFRDPSKQMILCLRLATCTWTTRQHPVSLGTVRDFWDFQMKVAPVLWQVELPTGFWQVSIVCLHSTPHTAAHLKRLRQASTSMQVPRTVVGLRQLSLRASLLLYLSCRSFPSCERLHSLCRKLLCCFPPHLRTARLSTCEPPKPQSFLTFAPAPLLPRPQPRHASFVNRMPASSWAVSRLVELLCTCSGCCRCALSTQLQASRLSAHSPVAVEAEARKLRQFRPVSVLHIKALLCKVEPSPSKGTRGFAMRLRGFTFQLLELLGGRLPMQDPLLKRAMPVLQEVKVLVPWRVLRSVGSTRGSCSKLEAREVLRETGRCPRKASIAKLPGLDSLRRVFLLAGGFSDSVLLGGLVLSPLLSHCRARPCVARPSGSCACVACRIIPRPSCSRQAWRGALLRNEPRRPASGLWVLTKETWRRIVLPWSAIRLLGSLTGVRVSTYHSPAIFSGASLCTPSCVGSLQTGRARSFPTLSLASFLQSVKSVAVQSSLSAEGSLRFPETGRRVELRRVKPRVSVTLRMRQRRQRLIASRQVQRSYRSCRQPKRNTSEASAFWISNGFPSCESLRRASNNLRVPSNRGFQGFGQFLGTESRAFMLSGTWQMQVAQLRLLASKAVANLKRSVFVVSPSCRLGRCAAAPPAAGSAKPCLVLTDLELTRSMIHLINFSLAPPLSAKCQSYGCGFCRSCLAVASEGSAAQAC